MQRTCRNPILGGFYPDPSICRVGGGEPPSDFYLVNSTFAYFPGIPVFHSRDLLHWRQIGNAIDRPGQLNFDGHRISEGLFAPTIRHHQGVFYILCTLIKGGGNFIITANDPAGPWSDPVWLVGAQGIDPSIFFDDDGAVWYMGCNPEPEGKAYPGNCEIYIQEMDFSLLSAGKNPLLGTRVGIWRGALKNAIWPEGPHIYKMNDFYYLLYAEGGTSRDHAVCVARARNIKGPWEGKKSNPVLTHRYLGKNAAIVNVGHADLVDDANGNWWMVLLASRTFNPAPNLASPNTNNPVDGLGAGCPLGRETFMVPVVWEDDWPMVATPTGLVEEEFPLPSFEKNVDDTWRHESACDHFNGALPLHWLTLRMPARAEDAAFSLTARPGALRLFTKAPTMRGADHPAFAGRRLRHKNWAFSAAIAFTPHTATETAGIILLQSEDWQYRCELYRAADSCGLRLIRAAGKEDEVIAEEVHLIKYLTQRREDAEEDELFANISPSFVSRTIGSTRLCERSLEDILPLVLAARCEEMEISFFYGTDQYSLKHFAGPLDARILSAEYAGGFVGTLAGVFASGNGNDTANYADVVWAEYKGLD